jgi:glycosyltransferase involved in cell wall biosynthesis
MKQLHVVGSFPVGTHTFVLWQLIGAHALGHQTTVLAANSGNDSGYQLAKQLGLDDRTAIYANYRTTSPWRPDLRRFSPSVSHAANKALYGRVLAERRKCFFCELISMPAIRQVDLIQVHFINWAIEVGLPLAKLLNLPCVVTAHGAVADTSVEFLQYTQKHADAIVVVSESERQAWIERTGSDQKLHRVWNGLPIGSIPQRTSAPPSHNPKLVTIGRLSPEKRISDIVEAVARLRDIGCDCELTIFGEGPLRSAIASQIKHLNLADRIHLKGIVQHEKVMEQLASSDMLVHAAEAEPFGLAMIEGMATGLPVVAARSNGASEILVHGKTGFLYEPGDVTNLVEHVIRLKDDAELSAAMGHAGRQRVEQEFSLEAHMRNMEQVWRSALSGHARNK